MVNEFPSWGQVTYQNGTWVDNSFTPANVDLQGDEFVRFSYFVIVLGFAILCHSFIINKYKTSIVRVATDVACIATICQSFSLLQCSKSCTPIESVVWVNLLSNAIFSAVVQGCDNWMTFARYAVVVGWKISNTRYILTSIFVIVGLYFCWWPFFTLAPLIASMNSAEALLLYTDFQFYWNFPLYTLYNLYHSYLLFIEIRRVRKESVMDTSKLEIMAFKSVLHDLISIVAVGCYAFTYPLGGSLQDVLLLCALHFIFNWKTPTKVFTHFYRSLADMETIKNSRRLSKVVPHYSSKLKLESVKKVEVAMICGKPGLESPKGTFDDQDSNSSTSV